jgi:hypothetical protein
VWQLLRTLVVLAVTVGIVASASRDRPWTTRLAEWEARVTKFLTTALGLLPQRARRAE